MVYIYKCISTVMDRLLTKFAAMVNAGEIKEGDELPTRFTFEELEYLFINGYIYDDGSTFIVAVADGFE